MAAPRFAILWCAPLVLAGCAGARPPSPSVGVDSQRQSLLALQAMDLRVATVAFRLAAAGSDICPVKSPLTGLTLHDAAQYAPELRAAARAAFGLNDGVALLAVVPASPAEKAGLRDGDTLKTVGEATLATAPLGRNATYRNVAAAYDSLERGARAGRLVLRVERDARIVTVTLDPQPGCASRVQLLPSRRIEARADGGNLSLTTGMLSYVRNNDELALVIAHEMAHNALGHRALLRSQGVERNMFGSFGTHAAKIQETERAADRLGYYLMARAGFDIAVAPAFWQRLHLGPALDGSPATTHPPSAARIAEALAVTKEIGRKRRDGQPLTPDKTR